MSHLRAAEPNEIPHAAEPRRTVGKVEDFARELAAALDVAYVADTPWTVQEVPAGRMPEDGTLWNVTAAVDGVTARFLIRRQWNDPSRANIVFDLPECAGHVRGYVLSDAQNATTKTLTAQMAGGAAPTARRLARKMTDYVTLLMHIEEWNTARQNGAAVRDELALKIVNLYGGYARGVGDVAADGVTIYPGIGKDGRAVKSIELSADGTTANITLWDFPAARLGELIALVTRP